MEYKIKKLERIDCRYSEKTVKIDELKPGALFLSPQLNSVFMVCKSGLTDFPYVINLDTNEVISIGEYKENYPNIYVQLLVQKKPLKLYNIFE